MAKVNLENIKKAKKNNEIEGLTVTNEMVAKLIQALEDPIIKKEDLIKTLLKQ
ncbi:MAG: hypothetical protein GY928_01640 [Colwellia sp.]|nr:hypothetical protein [Colwellia sp.]